MGSVDSIITMMLLLVLTNMFLAPLVRGHGALTSPPSWGDGWGYWGTKPKQQCSAGYDITFQGDSNKVGYNCMWYSSNVTIPGSQTLDSEMRPSPSSTMTRTWSGGWGATPGCHLALLQCLDHV